MFPLPFRAKEQLETGLLLPLRNVVLLPGVTIPVVAGQSRSIAVAESVMTSEQKQVIVAAVRPEVIQTLEKRDREEIETLTEIYSVATLAIAHKIIRLPAGLVQLIVEGQERVRIKEIVQTAPTYTIKFERLTNPIAVERDRQTIEALASAIQSLWQETASLNPHFPEEVLAVLLNTDDPAQLAYQTTILLQKEVSKMQSLLEEDNLEKLLRQVLAELQQEIEVQRLRSQILGETKKELDQQQKEFFLRQQLKKIHEELGEINSEKQEIEELRSRMIAANLPEPAEKQAKRELARLERIGNASAEGGVIRTYLDWILEMPWHTTVEDNLDLKNAREVLDIDHYGLSKVKDCIIEHLATFKLKRQSQERQQSSPPLPLSPSPSHPLSPSSPNYTVGTVLCFAGPPGVGKTSLGRSIARALGRPFERIGLGGLRDEAELRGHRRTYIGAMPGRIVQALHRAGANNPVIMLDELDKIGMDYRGDPSSALLEILDPQQNYSFRDLYLDLDFDLSRILFIGTANDLSNIPAPLLDRLETIELSGYSEAEKLAIAQQYLLPRQIEKAGLPDNALQLSVETLRQVIEDYTREAGVRKLEQQLGALCRKVAVRYANGETSPITIHPEQLEELLGLPHYLKEERRKIGQPGVATGLAWTQQGGEILFVEAVLLPEGEGMTLTGQLGDVMQESAQLAYSYVWSNAEAFGIEAAVFKENGLHVHVPAGAIPKDGPSAGVTMAVAIASLLTNQPVRIDTAMTGEINLSGELLPIGGTREKVLAAHRVGIKRIILPKQNERDLIDIPKDVSQEMEFISCDRVEQVLENALLEQQIDKVVL